MCQRFERLDRERLLPSAIFSGQSDDLDGPGGSAEPSAGCVRYGERRHVVKRRTLFGVRTVLIAGLASSSLRCDGGGSAHSTTGTASIGGSGGTSSTGRTTGAGGASSSSSTGGSINSGSTTSSSTTSSGTGTSGGDGGTG